MFTEEIGGTEIILGLNSDLRNTENDFGGERLDFF